MMSENCPLKVLLVSSEVAPFAKSGGLGDVAGSLPKALKKENIDMIGMGPYVIHGETPLGRYAVNEDLDIKSERNRRLRLGLIMIAVTRLLLPDCNIAATTALQALHPLGRERG